MKTVFFFFTFLTAACAAAAPRAKARTGAAQEERAVRVCVLNDAEAPVAEDVIMSALMAVSVDYANHVGISLAPEPIRQWKGEISAWQVDMGFALRKACPESAEIRILFSDAAPSRAETEPHELRPDETDDAMAGDASPYFGYAIVYRSSKRWETWNAAGERATIGTLRHEVGHLFGRDDDPDARSFMHSPSDASKGEWTPEVTAAIRKERGRRWYPKR